MLRDHRKSLNFPEPESKQENKIPASLSSLATGKVTREKYVKILGKYYPIGGMIVGVIVTQRILLTTPVVFFFLFVCLFCFFFFKQFSLHSFLFWDEFLGSSRGGEVTTAEVSLSVPHSMKSGNHCFKQKRQHQSHINIILVQGRE